MKLASIFSLVALVASPFSAVAADIECTATAEFSIEQTLVNDPTSTEMNWAAGRLISSYNAINNVATPPGQAMSITGTTYTINGASTLKQIQARNPADGEEKQQVAENNLRGKVGRYVYSAFLSALLSISCHLCADDDDSFSSSTITDAAVSVVLEEKKLTVQKKRNWLSTSDLEDWQEALCDELVGYGNPFTYAHDCTITLTGTGC